ncbi:MAG: TVP38/TMEM64 family protein [Spirochaetales bacterium]|nr:TVP38/TMEM64 family protein [Spirochaetales bacterium]
MNVKRTAAIIGFPLTLVLLTAVSLYFQEHLLSFFFSVERFREQILAAGWIGPFLFVALQFVQVVLFVIPGEIPQIAGGYLFGIAGGTLLSIVGIMAGSGVNFLLGRVLGRPFVEAVIGKTRTDHFEQLIASEKAQTAFFLFFLVPGVPKDALCYAGGLSKMRFFPFLAITLLGRFPALFGSAVIGSAVAEKNWVLLVSVSIVVVLIVGMGFLHRGALHEFIRRFHKPG